jgi:hypothetical protein
LIECYIGENVDLFLLGQTLAGLYEQPQAVKLRRVKWIKNPICVALDVDGLKIAIELSDHSDLWEMPLLEWCDVYAKRNINTRYSTALQKKIIPFGLLMASHSRRSMLAALAALAGTLPSASKSRLKAIYRYLATPQWKFFEHRPEQPVDTTILFQTRVWEPQESPGDEGINEQRVSLLRALKREFGSRVVGGIVPTPLAHKTYPDLITNMPCRQPQYIRWAKRPLIGIYFRGLFGAIAIKMAEYLAGSKCIVSEPIGNELIAPLDHISIYRSNEDCLEACERLLGNPSLAEFQRMESWKYYQAHVAPRAHFADLLIRAKAAHDRLTTA